jgi:hypothetical protein
MFLVASTHTVGDVQVKKINGSKGLRNCQIQTKTGPTYDKPLLVNRVRNKYVKRF